MGLDMYLYAKLYTSKYSKEELNNKLFELLKEQGIFRSDNLDTIELKIEVGYWRKANAIHDWFVENVQDGKDECQESYVSRDDLIKLKALCVEVLNNKELAQEKLPTQSGFFFGSTEYDEYYFDDLKDTIKTIDYCLTLPDSCDFEYRASW